MQFGPGFVSKSLGLVLLGTVAAGMSSPAEAGILDWWFDLIGKDTPVRVPEPATLALFATGAAALRLIKRRPSK